MRPSPVTLAALALAIPGFVLGYQLGGSREQPPQRPMPPLVARDEPQRTALPLPTPTRVPALPAPRRAPKPEASPTAPLPPAPPPAPTPAAPVAPAPVPAAPVPVAPAPVPAPPPPPAPVVVVPAE